jgi:hypothetical protein
MFYYHSPFKKKKKDLLKKIDNFNILISKDLSLIKDRQKELCKNRNPVNQMRYKLDEYFENHPSIPIINSSSSSSSSSKFSLLNSKEIPRNWNDKVILHFITEKIMKDRLSFSTADNRENYTEHWNNDVMNEKLEKFKHIQGLYKKFYDHKTIKHYLSHMFKIDDD